MTFTIRRAAPEDAPGIARAHVASWQTSYRGILSEDFLRDLSVERREKSWREMLSAPDHPAFLFVAAQGDTGQIVGFASGRPAPEGEACAGELGAIYLLQEFQGRGLGRRLMQAAAGELHARGFASMLLWVLRDNIPARKFYEALGGAYLREKPITIGGQELIEVAYGWQDIRSLTPGQEETCHHNSKA